MVILNIDNNRNCFEKLYKKQIVKKYNFHEHCNKKKIRYEEYDILNPVKFREQKYFVKIVDKNLKSKYRNYTYKMGLNIDNNNLSIFELYSGLFFTTIDQIFRYIEYGNMILIIEPKSNIHVTYESFKCQQLYVHEILTLERFINSLPNYMWLYLLNNSTRYNLCKLYKKISKRKLSKVKKKIMHQYRLDKHIDYRYVYPIMKIKKIPSPKIRICKNLPVTNCMKFPKKKL